MQFLRKIIGLPSIAIGSRMAVWLICVALCASLLPAASPLYAQGTIAASAATLFLNIPPAGPADVSGTIGDPTDPARTIGIDFDVTPTDLPVTASSSDQNVVPDANLALTDNGGGNWTLKITPLAAGTATITVQADAAIYTINYAASAASTTPDTSLFLTGANEASTAIAVNENYMFVGDDEDNKLRLYHRKQSGLPVRDAADFDFSAELGVGKKMDIEASTAVVDRIYWLGSHSNNGDGDPRPDRRRLFATDLTRNGDTSSLTYVGHYSGLRERLAAWDAGNNNVLGLTAAQIGPPESPDGFNIEGLAMKPGSVTTAYIGFRAPLAPGDNPRKALIVPLTNMTDLVTGVASSATFTTPILLDLGGRGIRSIECNATDCLISAGSADSGPGSKDFRLYHWSGDAADTTPTLLPTDLTALKAGGSFETIVQVPVSLPLNGESPIQLLVDNGDTTWYPGAVNLPVNWHKFRSDLVLLGSPAPSGITVCSTACSHSTIQAALDDPNTGDGATISVLDDPHTEGGIVVGKNVTIQGGGVQAQAGQAQALITVQAAATRGTATERVFTIEKGSTVTLRNLRIRHGNPAGAGGGVFNGGNLTVLDSVIADNDAADGGGIINEDILVIVNSGLYNNVADTWGGAITNNQAMVTIRNSTISGNRATGSVQADHGGGAINQFGDGAVTTIVFSTIAGNHAPNVVGQDGIWPQSGVVTVRNSIVASNGEGVGKANCSIEDGVTFTAESENLDDDGTCPGFSQGSSGAPGLGPLADNGGAPGGNAILTHALQPGSPAIDAIAVAACGEVSTDQRHVARPQDGTGDGTAACDMGSFELEAGANRAPSFSSQPKTGATVGESYTYNITTSDPDPGDTRSIQAPVKPDWLTLVDNGDGTATLSGTPAGADAGDHTVQLEVKDAAGATEPQTFIIFVDSAGEKPSVLVESRVTQSSDDAEELNAVDPIYLDSSDLELTFDIARQTNQTVGIRFANLAIPPQATISQAYIEFTTDEVSEEATSLRINGEATGNALTFNSSPASISQRNQTAASVAWDNIPGWSSVGGKHSTPDLTAIVQELVNRVDWSSGNAISFILSGTGRRTASSFDGSPQNAPLLHVEFSGATSSTGASVYLPAIASQRPPSVSPAALIPFDAVWKYRDDGSDQGIDWRNRDGFDDSTWSEGAAQLGYGDGDEKTTIGFGSNPASKYITTYFRHAFVVADPAAYKMLDLQLLRDDGAVVYLNGQEILRSNMPGGEIRHTTLAPTAVVTDSEILRYQQTVDPKLLVKGHNMLAVEIHQATGGSSDVSFELLLSGTPQGASRFAVIGDYGKDGPDEAAVAALVKSWQPDIVITAGDNNYNDGAQETIVANIDKHYSDFITQDPKTNRFYPSLGNHDWRTTDVQPYLDHFTLPGNERYYDFVRDGVHFFAVDSDGHEPDGNSATSTQAKWLQGALAGSSAKWKVVYFHHPPYSSGVHGSSTFMRWPFAAWGASTTIAGHEHSYERLVVDGFPHFVSGLGGQARRLCQALLPQSKNCYDAKHGAMLVEVTDSQMVLRFITHDGAIIDSCTLPGDCE